MDVEETIEAGENKAELPAGIDPKLFENLKTFRTDVLAYTRELLFDEEDDYAARRRTAKTLSLLSETLTATLEELHELMEIKPDIEFTQAELERMFDRKSATVAMGTTLRSLQAVIRRA